MPDTIEGEVYYPLASAYEVSDSTIAPRYMPSEVTIDLLRSQLTTVCTDPLWLDDSALCGELGDLLDMAEADEDESNFYGAAAVLQRLHDRVEEEESEMHPNAFWLLALNAAQARENALSAAGSAAWLWHLRSAPDSSVVAGGWAMSGQTQQIGSVEANVPAGASDTLYFVRELESGTAFADGVWSVQLDLIEMSHNEGGLSLHDVRVHRYSSTGTELEAKYLHQGQLMAIPAGATRVSVSENLTGWSSGSSGDRLVLSFRFENDNASAQERYNVRVGVQYSDWGGSWLSQPAVPD